MELKFFFKKRFFKNQRKDICVIAEKDVGIEKEVHDYVLDPNVNTNRLIDISTLTSYIGDKLNIKKYEKEIDLMLEGLFPEILTDNEIKAASIPFSFTSFKFSKEYGVIEKE